jgi:resuscitation-promoting factor RpfB
MSNPSRFRTVVILLAVIVIIGVALALGLRKTVTLDIDGQSQSVTTYAFTVGNLFHEVEIPLSPVDQLSPSIDMWLKNGDRVTLTRAIPAQILVNGQIRSLYTADRTPTNLLASVGINVQKGDRVLSNGQEIDPSQPFPANSRSISLQISPLINYSLTIDGIRTDLTSTASTLGSALWAAGYTFFATDPLNPPANTPLTPGLSSTLKPSQQVTVHVQDAVVTTRTAATTVGGALIDAGLSLQGLDYSIPSPESPIPSIPEIRLVRVNEEVLVEQSPLPFETQYQPDPDLEIDNQSILQTGEYGLSAQRVRVRYEDGQETSRQQENQWVARQPQSRIIGYGTSVVMHSAVVDGVPIQYWRAINMYATSYHPSNTGSTTASGLPLRKGVAAVDTSLIPFYTQMFVPGYGEVIAADIGGGVIGRWIDLGYSDDDYVAWHQSVMVYFLWPPPANIVWILP